jgi:hypothetical protein
MVRNKQRYVDRAIIVRVFRDESPARGLTCSQTDSVVVSRGRGTSLCGTIYVRARASALRRVPNTCIRIYIYIYISVCVRERAPVYVQECAAVSTARIGMCGMIGIEFF